MPRRNLSRAEIQKNYRQRQKDKNSDEFLAKERARWHRRRENKSVKVIADCSSREQRTIRKEWRQRHARCRIRKKYTTASSPTAEALVMMQYQAL